MTAHKERSSEPAIFLVLFVGKVGPRFIEKFDRSVWADEPAPERFPVPACGSARRAKICDIPTDSTPEPTGLVARFYTERRAWGHWRGSERFVRVCKYVAEVT